MIFPWSWSLFLMTFLGVFCSGSSASPLLFVRELLVIEGGIDDGTDSDNAPPAEAKSAVPNPWPIVIGVLSAVLALLLLTLAYLYYTSRRRGKQADPEQGKKPRSIFFDKKKMGGKDLTEHPNGWVKGFQLVLPRSNSTKSNGSTRSDDSSIWDAGYRQSAIFHDVNLGGSGPGPEKSAAPPPYVPSLARPRRVATQNQPMLPPIRRHESLMSVLSVHGTPSLTNRNEMDQAYAELLKELHEENNCSSPSSYSGSSPASPPGIPAIMTRAIRRRSNSTPQLHHFNSTSTSASTASSPRSKSSTRQPAPKSASHVRQPSGPRYESTGIRGRQLTPSTRQAQPIRNLPSLATELAKPHPRLPAMSSPRPQQKSFRDVAPPLPSARTVLYVTNATPWDRYSADSDVSYTPEHVQTAPNGERTYLGRPHTARSAGVTSRGFKVTAPLQGNYI